MVAMLPCQPLVPAHTGTGQKGAGPSPSGQRPPGREKEAARAEKEAARAARTELKRQAAVEARAERERQAAADAAELERLAAVEAVIEAAEAAEAAEAEAGGGCQEGIGWAKKTKGRSRWWADSEAVSPEELPAQQETVIGMALDDLAAGDGGPGELEPLHMTWGGEFYTPGAEDMACGIRHFGYPAAPTPLAASSTQAVSATHTSVAPMALDAIQEEMTEI
ncbi:hypothetical protein CYMTET_52738 [Cymbomonas tetramitiformis]|uniref:Uncharacterized protein n=1 Tax=Cymbomonas tetramitiformis TaxID=36881 RepID=A0AAE0BIF9_9CHLO|nr:hypothetical protein CYMTET_52738 [Cymbomonas tetramitiformis]